MAGIDLGERRSTPDDLWIPVTREQVRDWRKNLPNGWRRETTVERRPIAEHIHSEDDTVAMEGGGRDWRTLKPLEGRDTVSKMAADILGWARENPDLFMERVRFLKQQGQMQHLTDEQAANDLMGLCRKLAEDSARRVYERQGWLNPVVVR